MSTESLTWQPLYGPGNLCQNSWHTDLQDLVVYVHLLASVLSLSLFMDISQTVYMCERFLNGELEILENEEKEFDLLKCSRYLWLHHHVYASVHCIFYPILSDLYKGHHHYTSHFSTHTNAMMHTHKPADRHPLICSFGSWKTEQMMVSPFGAVPVVVVGGSVLIIPQNPSQMSLILGGRWVGAPPLLHGDGAGSSSNLLGITFNSHAFPGTAGQGDAICLACCGIQRETEKERKWEGEDSRFVCVCLCEWWGGSEWPYCPEGISKYFSGCRSV